LGPIVAERSTATADQPMTGAMSSGLRLLGIVAAGAVALAIAGPVVKGRVQADGRLTTSDGDTVEVTEAARAGGLTFAPGVAPGDRDWILAAVARARPEAARLIAEVDGLIVVGTFADAGTTLGVTRGSELGFTVDVNVGRLNGESAADRVTVVLHELGHVIDFALVPKALNATLDAQVPRGGPCGDAIDCDREEERFADTFAKWALRGAVSEVGAGYGIAMPASIESWGAPLAQLAYALPAG
jgi:hypothetical protein